MIYTILRISGELDLLSSYPERLDEALKAKINRKGYLVLDLSKNSDCHEHINEIEQKLTQLSNFLDEIMNNIERATIDIAISCPKNNKKTGVLVDIYHFQPELLVLIGQKNLHLEISNYE